MDAVIDSFVAITAKSTRSCGFSNVICEHARDVRPAQTRQYDAFLGLVLAD